MGKVGLTPLLTFAIEKSQSSAGLQDFAVQFLSKINFTGAPLPAQELLCSRLDLVDTSVCRLILAQMLCPTFHMFFFSRCAFFRC